MKNSEINVEKNSLGEKKESKKEEKKNEDPRPGVRYGKQVIFAFLNEKK